MPRVRIGARSVVEAGRVVTKDIPEGVFAAGNPCRILREIEEWPGKRPPRAIVMCFFPVAHEEANLVNG